MLKKREIFMRKVTKLFALITAMAMAFSLVACSSNKPVDSTVTEVESIEINDIELNTTDKDVVIEYTLMPEGAEGEVTMSIADDTIATIKDGKISAVSEGETELLVSVGEIAEVARVTVKDADKAENPDDSKEVVEDKKDSNSTTTKNNASTKSDTSTKNNGTSNSTASSSKSDEKPATTPTPEPAKPAATPTPEQKPAETPKPTPEQKPAEAPQPTPEPTPAPVATCPVCGSTEHTTHPPLDKNQNVGDGYHPGDDGTGDEYVD